MYPLKLTSVLKDILWGGTRLSEEYGKGTPGQKIAEAWVLSLRKDGENRIENGSLSGKTLSETGLFPEPFPLLIKLIDAHDRLSVQVHPNDAYARAAGLPAGKTEMWYVLDAKEGAELVYGIENVAKETLRKAAEEGKLEPYLKRKKVRKGDVFFIPAGLVHAIGDGILIAEVQQNSNTTYRLYDYDRRDKDGKARPLHIEEALRVLDSTLPHGENRPEILEKTEKVTRERLCRCEYFETERLALSDTEYSFDGEKMRFFLCLDGEGAFCHEGNRYSFRKGDAYLVPSKTGSFTIKTEKTCTLLVVCEKERRTG